MTNETTCDRPHVGDIWPAPGSRIPPPSDEAPTLRDLFAMAALAGLCALPSTDDYSCADLARQAYNLAEAMMLKARGGE